MVTICTALFNLTELGILYSDRIYTFHFVYRAKTMLFLNASELIFVV
jgi:hypothetical protein